MNNLVICGAAGRMGKRIIACALEEAGWKIAGAVEKPGHPWLGRDSGEIAGAGKTGACLGSSLADVIAGADVIVDFSSPETGVGNAVVAGQAGKPMVIGTTGLSPEQERAIRESLKKVAVVLAPNMSIGVNLLFELVGRAAAALGEDYDVEIVEAHHRFKKDAPSGTAVRIGKIVAEIRGQKWEAAAVHGRAGIVGERKRGQIGVHAVRAGDIVGEHTVIFSSLGERLELTHRAHSRDTFARGALLAARFVLQSPPGFYTMADVLSRTNNASARG